jgi:hypothetical protein
MFLYYNPVSFECPEDKSVGLYCPVHIAVKVYMQIYKFRFWLQMFRRIRLPLEDGSSRVFRNVAKHLQKRL